MLRPGHCVVLAALCASCTSTPAQPAAEPPAAGQQDEARPAVEAIVEPRVASNSGLLEGQELVEVAQAGSLPAGVVVHMSSTELVVDEHVLATLSDGKLEASAVRDHVVTLLSVLLRERLEAGLAAQDAGGEAWTGRAVFVLDRRVQFVSLVEAMYTAGQVGFTEFAFVVEVEGAAAHALKLAPPGSHALGEPAFKVFIGLDRLYVLLPGSEGPVELPNPDPQASGPEAYDRAALRELASAYRAEHPEIRTTVVSTEWQVRFEVLATIYAELLGPGCNQDEPSSCWFPQLVLEAGSG